MRITVPETHSEQRTGTFADRAEPGPGLPPGSLGGPAETRPRARHELVAQPVERLEAEVIELSGRLAAGTYELLVLVGELDQRGSWATWGALSCAAWLADTCDIEVSTARSQVRVARAMCRYPQLDAAMAAGDVSYSKARVLVPYLTVCATTDTVVTRTSAPAGASLAQQRADAFVALVTEGTGSGVQAEVVIHVTEDGNRLPDGTPLSDHAVAGLLTDAFVSLLMHDAERQPIDASPRRRNPTRRQRRVLDELHHECQQPGCHARAFLQYDHIQPYSHNGPTVIANLQRLCGPHNRCRQSP